MSKERILESPVFALCPLGVYIIVATGGGNEKFGVKNYLLSFKLTSSGLSEQLKSLELKNDIPTFISTIPYKNIFCVCVNNLIIFYKLDGKTGEFKEIYKLETMKEYTEEIFQSCVNINNEYLCAGTSTGVIKLYTIRYTNESITETVFVKENNISHLREINNLIVLSTKKIILTASSDGTCQMLEIPTLKMIRKISFRVSMEETTNYFIRDFAYDEINNFVYTLQNREKGKSFISKWDMGKNLEPVSTVEVSEDVCFSLDYNKYYNTIGVTESQGNVIFVDANKHMEVVCKKNVGENMIKCGKFCNKMFVTGSVDNKLRINKIATKSHISFWFLFKVIIFGLIAYRIYEIQLKNMKK